jgi:hypothetical protein
MGQPSQVSSQIEYAQIGCGRGTGPRRADVQSAIRRVYACAAIAYVVALNKIPISLALPAASYAIVAVIATSYGTSRSAGRSSASP